MLRIYFLERAGRDSVEKMASGKTREQQTETLVLIKAIAWQGIELKMSS